MVVEVRSYKATVRLDADPKTVSTVQKNVWQMIMMFSMKLTTKNKIYEYKLSLNSKS